MSTPLVGDRNFRNQPVRIADLTVNTVVIEGYQFSNCRILGPAVLMPDQSTFAGCGWDAPDVESVFWEVASTRPFVVGAVRVVGCEFANCRFEAVGLAGLASLRTILARGFAIEP